MSRSMVEGVGSNVLCLYSTCLGCTKKTLVLIPSTVEAHLD